ncbi:choice-of-anchor Q domain-containing protein [Dokdonella fugitiva]|uniref:choice-of-anchor Q domain-containing protein n=1 Tax=Dokdonella fugitiva TaxID=328517 RepID=UPI003D18B7BA
MTHALAEGSPAMDAGDSEFCPPIDQRGVERPNGSGCDLGAFEIEQERLFHDGFDGLPVPEAAPSSR